MKALFQKIVAAYQAHGHFYAFVSGLEGVIVAALVSWSGGIPTTKAAWLTFGAFIGKAIWGYVKGAIQNA